LTGGGVGMIKFIMLQKKRRVFKRVKGGRASGNQEFLRK